uniref:Uncharacterized protein n=1 Tax=Rhizophora mucronata TaxID=61149 RepID=A0A2P2NGV7_RHIMU
MMLHTLSAIVHSLAGSSLYPAWHVSSYYYSSLDQISDQLPSY